jgi:hypothetical protein
MKFWSGPDITPRRLSPPLLLPCLGRRYEVLYQQTGLIEVPVIGCKSQRDLHEIERSRWPLLLLEAAASSLILELNLATIQEFHLETKDYKR